MEKRIGEKAPGLSISAEGLPVKVQGIEGPVVEGELPKSKEFGKRIAQIVRPRTLHPSHSTRKGETKPAHGDAN